MAQHSLTYSPIFDVISRGTFSQSSLRLSKHIVPATKNGFVLRLRLYGFLQTENYHALRRRYMVTVKFASDFVLLSFLFLFLFGKSIAGHARLVQDISTGDKHHIQESIYDEIAESCGKEVDLQRNNLARTQSCLWPLSIVYWAISVGAFWRFWTEWIVKDMQIVTKGMYFQRLRFE